MPYADPEKRKQFYEEYRKKNAAELKRKGEIYRKNNREKIRAQNTAYRQANREKLNASAKEYRERNKEKRARCDKLWREKNADIIKARWKAKYKANKEYFLSLNRKWRAENSERFKAWCKEYYDSRPNENKAKKQKRYAQLKAAGDKLNPDKAFRVYIVEKFNGACFKCAKRAKLTLDHHNPVAHGYRLTEENAVLLCLSCNVSKKSKPPHEFYTKTELKKLREWYGVKTLYRGELRGVN